MSEGSVIMRRIIRIGEKSTGITIPREWLNSIGADLGSLVRVSISGRSIIVSPMEEKETSVSEIPLDTREFSSPEAFSRILIASYLEGLDRIVVSGDRIAIRKAFNDVFTKLPGIVLFESGERSEFRITVDENVMSLMAIIKTLSSSSLMMFDLLDKYLSTGDLSHLDQLFALDDDLDRLHFMGIRLIKKSPGMSTAEAGDLIVLIKSLEHVGDSLDRTARFMQRIKLDERCVKTASEIFRIAREYYEKSLEAYISKDITTALNLLSNRARTMDNLIESVIRTTCSNELSGVLHEALNIIAISAEIGELTASSYAREKISMLSKGESQKLSS
ncbi:MAG: PhoU domain-containing protein [Sulfolobales archaeon]